MRAAVFFVRGKTLYLFSLYYVLRCGGTSACAGFVSATGRLDLSAFAGRKDPFCVHERRRPDIV